MIRLRHFIILGLLAVAGWLIRTNERALGIGQVRATVAQIPKGLTLSDTRPSLAGSILLASLVGIAIASTWIWFTAKAMA